MNIYIGDKKMTTTNKEKGIYELSGEEVEYYEKRYMQIAKGNHLEECTELVKALGLGGLWRGHQAAVVMVYDFKYPAARAGY